MLAVALAELEVFVVSYRQKKAAGNVNGNMDNGHI